MARYQTTIESALSPAEAFAYMADFSNARHWDPSVETASQLHGGPVGPGTEFHLVVRFGGRRVALHYTIVSFDEPRSFVVEARQPSFVSRDTVTVATPGDASQQQGSRVHYDAALDFRGVGRVLEPILQLLFNRTGAKAAAGMRAALNP
jgi:hypothetical protein